MSCDKPTHEKQLTMCCYMIFTSYNNPKGNADTERVMRTLKEECLGLREWTSPFDYRGRDAGHPAPSAQLRPCGTPAYGSDLGCGASKRTRGNGCRRRWGGIHRRINGLSRCQFRRVF